ncbi:MAG: iron-sulfur cluster-binding protein [Planctomycetes bacterium]|nr:iron-sulfur cluster-binding protein [Planctomycetota bacterium]
MLSPEGNFAERSSGAVTDDKLRKAVRKTVDRLRDLRRADELPDPKTLERRAKAQAVREHSVAELPQLLAQFTENCERRGGHVHRATDAHEACSIALSILRSHGAQRVVKSKSMVTEEIGLNEALEHAGLEVTETDLGEWIIQLAGEKPSHIILPAIHKTRHDVQALFEAESGMTLSSDTARLCAHARVRLREKFLQADAGVSGVNFAVAATGSIALFTNEGNGRLVTTLPRVHIAFLGMERIVLDLDSLAAMAEVLPRSATGQKLTSYFSIITGPRRADEVDGPDHLHVIVVDNGRSAVWKDPEFRDVLRCIRCAACLNVCPVYAQVGGHSYGGTYPGPIGAVLTPLLRPEERSANELAEASTLCAACTEACPVGIPLHEMLVRLRAREQKEHPRRLERLALRVAFRLLRSPRAAVIPRVLRLAASGTGTALLLKKLVPPLERWQRARSLPPAPARTFRALWQELEMEEHHAH